MKPVSIPEQVLSQTAPALVVSVARGEVAFFIAETAWGLAKYPRICPVEMRFGTWELDPVTLVAVVLRLAQSDACTFDYWIDTQSPEGVRILQSLAAQNEIDVHLVTTELARSLRVKNPAVIEAASLVDQLRTGRRWTPTEYMDAFARINKLYPTAPVLWRGCAPEKRSG
ncbi:MAG TPA: hypothetical protein PLP66_01970 [Phycisphaerae bacterium]|nr:hypothetical protein [Phycisphaerae bacterium]HPM22642.1 hypothetical protein [Phycisphaerae bacterium]